MIHQCAWCGSFIIKGLRITQPMPKNSTCSHGICVTCKHEVLGKYSEENKSVFSQKSLEAA